MHCTHMVLSAVPHPLTLTAVPRDVFAGQMTFMTTKQQRQSAEGIIPSSADCRSMDVRTNDIPSDHSCCSQCHCRS